MDLLNPFSFSEPCLAWLNDSQNVAGVPAFAGMLTCFGEFVAPSEFYSSGSFQTSQCSNNKSQEKLKNALKHLLGKFHR